MPSLEICRDMARENTNGGPKCKICRKWYHEVCEGVDIQSLNIQIVSCIVPNVFHFKHIYTICLHILYLFILFVFTVLVGHVKFLSLLSLVNYVQTLVLILFLSSA